MTDKHKKYYLKNKNKISLRAKKYYEKNKEKISITSKKYYEHNKDKILNYQQQYYQDNKNKILEKQKEYQLKNKEKLTRQLDFKNNTADMGSVRSVDEFIVHPNDFKTLKIGECYLKTTLPSGKLFIKKIQVDPTCLDDLIQHLNK